MMHDAGRSPLSYGVCHYGGSRVRFRGPERPTDGAFIAILGGSATFGRFVPMPFADKLETLIGLPCANLGVPQSGPDLYLLEPGLSALVARASATVIEVPPLPVLSNAFYTVHPRRNDRFLKASDTLAALYPEVDFTEFHFVGHMLARLEAVSATRFRQVVHELAAAWANRMSKLVAQSQGPVILLRISADDDGADRSLMPTEALLDEIACDTVKRVDFVASEEALADGVLGMVFHPDEAALAAALPGPAAHAEIAQALCPLLREACGPHA